MRHLLIGGAGFIGTSMIEALGRRDVVVFDNLSPVVHNPASIRSFLEKDVEFIVGDVTKREDVEGLLDQHGMPESVVYLAAETGTGRSLYNCSLNARINTLGLATVLDAISARNAMPKRIVLSSTRAIYGEGPYMDTNENLVFPDPRLQADLEMRRFEYDGLMALAMDASRHMPKPTNIYGSTKLSQENLLQNWSSAFNVPLYIFRLQNVYGAGQSLTNPYTGVLIHFIKESLAGRPVQIYENGGITRDFIHVDDVAHLLSLAATGKGDPGLFDCGSGERVYLEDIAKTLAEIGNAPAPVRCSNYRLGDVRNACAAIERTIQAFNWTPQVSLHQGLNELNKFVRERIN